jgi:hypothetical protein
MKRLIFVLLVAIAAWYGYKHYPDILHRRGSNDVVIENSSGKNMERIRVMIDGQTLVKETLPDGQTASIPFNVQNDASFKLEWQYEGILGTHTWSGGMVPKGPMLQRHILTIDGDDAVMYRAENKLGS